MLKRLVHKALLILFLPSLGVAQAAELSCPPFRSEVVEILASIPLSSAPPKGRDFFSMTPPVLEIAPAFRHRYIAEQYEIIGKTLNVIFCGVWPLAAQSRLIIRVGPREIWMIPDAQASKRTPPPRQDQIIVNTSESISIDWASPVKLTIQQPQKVAEEALAIHFAAPPGLRVRIKLLKVSLIFTSPTHGCRSVGPSTTTEIEAYKIPVHVLATVSGKSRPARYAATYNPAIRCGPPETLEIDLGSFTAPELAQLQVLSVSISRRLEISSLARLKLVNLCLSTQVCPPEVPSIMPLAKSLIVDANVSNVYPKTFALGTEVPW